MYEELVQKLIPTLNFKFPYSVEEWCNHYYLENYHSHSFFSNPSTTDSPTSMEQYVERVKKFGTKCIYSMEHGTQGNYYLCYDLAEKNDLICIHGTEAYWVKDRHEKDNMNCHIILHALNNDGRREINYMLSIANEDGYYYKPRVDLELIMNLNPQNIICTSACVIGWKYEDADAIWLKIAKHFGRHFFFELQYHNTESQKILNERILKLSRDNNIDIICGLDSHYIEPNDTIKREQLLEYKNIQYPDEDGWYMDYPDTLTVINRFKEQGVLSEEEIIRSILNTNIFASNEVIPIVLDRSFKIPTIYPDKSYDEKVKIYKNELNKAYKKEKFKSKEKADGIRFEAGQVIDSGVVDYFLTSKKMVDLATQKYGGILTTTGRGSSASFVTNKLFGLTTIDRFNSDVPMYAERFLTKDRVIGNHSLPDIDNNIVSQQPFVSALKEMIGEHSVYPLMAIEVLKEKNAWQMYASNANIEPSVANQISKYIDAYNMALKHADDDEKANIHIEDYIKEPYYSIYMQSRDYQGIVTNLKCHACFTKDQLVMTSLGYKNIQDIEIGDSVLSHDNQFHQVVKTFKLQSDNIYKVKITGDEIELTGNHPLYVRTSTGSGCNKIWGEPHWVQTEDLTLGDYVGCPINTESRIPTYQNTNKTCKNEYLDLNDPDFWWFVGRYVGDGWTEHPKPHDYRIFLCCGKKDSSFMEIVSMLPSYIKMRVYEARTTYKFTTNNKVLYEYLSQFGKYAYGKHLTNDILDLPVPLLKSFLEGYLSSDGNINFANKSIMNEFCTVSKELAYGLQQCIHKVFHVPCTITTDKPGIDIIEGRTVNRRKKYRGHFCLINRPRAIDKYIDGIVWYKIRRIEKLTGKEDVYNLSVLDSNSYTINNFAVHNCGYFICNFDIRKEIGLVSAVSKSTGNRTLCAAIEGSYLDEFGLVKEDLLIVDSVGLTYEFFKSIGQDVPSFDTLREMIKGDKATWDIYAKGITCCVNQCEKESTTQKVMKYKPQNISELAQFIAAIRPGFASLLNVFLNRQPYTTGEPEIDKVLEDSAHFMLFQESIMKVLNYLGLPMSDTYGIIKSISKKKLKGEKKEHLLATLKSDWKEKIGNLDNFDKIWKVISDAARYSFNCSHAYEMAGDSLYQAWFKAHHTAKFYEVAIKHYQQKGKKEKIDALLKEALNVYGYKLADYKFGDDNREVHVDDKLKLIIPNISSIKGIGDNVGTVLYDIGKVPYKSFYEVLEACYSYGINTTIVERLIEINYFDQYGEIYKLLQMKWYYELFKRGTAKSIGKNKVEKYNLPVDLIRKYSKETDKMYSKLDSVSILNELENTIPNKSVSKLTKLRYEYLVMGICRTVIPEQNKRDYLVLDIDSKKSMSNISLYSIQSGKLQSCKCWNSTMRDQYEGTVLIKNGDIIRVLNVDKVEKKEKSNFVDPNTGKYIYQTVDGEYEYWLRSWSTLDND